MLRFTSSLSPYGRRRSQEKWELLGVHLASPLGLLCFKVSQQKSRGRAACDHEELEKDWTREMSVSSIFEQWIIGNERRRNGNKHTHLRNCVTSLPPMWLFRYLFCDHNSYRHQSLKCGPVLVSLFWQISITQSFHLPISHFLCRKCQWVAEFVFHCGVSLAYAFIFYLYSTA